MSFRHSTLLASLLLISTATGFTAAADWTQFHGPDGSGVSDAKGTPLNWSDSSGQVWKTDLPGPGASSPVVFGDRIFLTCYTGFGPGINGGNMDSLQRHLLCLDRATGKLLWNTAIAADLPEQDRIREDHGFATSTPAVDAARVYVFFGKSGVFAFDHAGKQLWNTKVGTQLNGWGSATSPVLHKELVLVNASVESSSLVALDRKTGREVWRARGISESWHAPALVTLPGGKTEVVTAMSKRVLAFDADTGQPAWNCDTGIYWYMCPTPVVRDGVVYLIGGRGPTVTMAVRAGGRGDVNATHVLWKNGKGSNVPSPVYHDGHLYFAHENLGLALCVNAKNGDVVYEERLAPSPGGIYASPVLADGKLYYFGRGGRAVVLAASPKFAKLADNTLENGRGVFNSTPAFDGPRLLVRSNRALYCLGEK
ncbi:serine/threonine protein kinase [Verrucomicrobiota bacterium]|nr:serine/threonine protein kinase [Verrucomicrobiota bacterium]